MGKPGWQPLASRSMRNGRVTTEKSLYLVKKDLSVTHINAVLKKNYIEVLGQGLNGVIINAQTVAMGLMFPGLLTLPALIHIVPPTAAYSVSTLR